MDFEKILVKCGDCHRYQYMLLVLYGCLMFIVSRHYFAQSVISFVPDHWCYHEQLENRSYAEIASIYSKFASPSCTRLESISSDGTNATASQEPCTRWIYHYDHGFRSMNADVSYKQIVPYNDKSKFGMAPERKPHKNFYHIGLGDCVMFYQNRKRKEAYSFQRIFY